MDDKILQQSIVQLLSFEQKTVGQTGLYEFRAVGIRGALVVSGNPMLHTPIADGRIKRRFWQPLHEGPTNVIPVEKGYTR